MRPPPGAAPWVQTESPLQDEGGEPPF